MNIRNNLLYSTLLTFSTYLVPLLVFPYISRVLGVEHIGAIDTVDSIIDYCVLFSMMGMSTLGIREVARHKDNHTELNQTFNNLFCLNTISTGCIFMALCLAIWLLPCLHQSTRLLTIGTIKLIANLFWIEWFYRGLEEFRYITLRSIAVRVLFIFSVFLCVTTSTDYITYYALFVGVVVLNAICNWSYKRRWVSLSFRHLNLQQYAKPFLFLGLFAILSAIYTKLSTPLLSMICGNEEAGYYSTATRMYQVIIALIASLINVLVPRMSVLIKEGNMQAIHHLYQKAFQMLFFFAIPIIIYIEVFAPNILAIFAGSGFEKAAWPMRIVIIQTLFIGAEQILILQLLIPLRQDKAIVISGMCGVLTWMTMSYIFVPTWHSIGTAIVWVISEIVVLCCAMLKVRQVLKYTFPWIQLVRTCLYSIPYGIMGIFIWKITESSLLRISVSAITFLIYALLLWKKTNLIHSPQAS